MMKFKRIFRCLAVVICLSLIATAITISAAAADDESIVKVTWKAGHQYYYDCGYGATNCFWASAMTVKYTKKNGTVLTTTQYNQQPLYTAWCASYGVSTPTVGDTYKLYKAGEHSYITNEKYYDTGLHQWIELKWAVSCVHAAQALGYLPSGWTISEDDAYAGGRLAIELAIRAKYLKDDTSGQYLKDITITGGYGGTEGMAKLNAMHKVRQDTPCWKGATDSETVKNFYAAVKEIYDYAELNLVDYDPDRLTNEPITWTENKVDPHDIDWSQESILIDTYTINNDGVVADYLTMYDGITGVMSADGKKLYVYADRDYLLDTVNSGTTFGWHFMLCYENQRYDVVYGVPLSYSGSAPQNIMMYAETYNYVAATGYYSAKTEHERGTITVNKTDTATGEALQSMGFKLYEVTASDTLVLMREESTDASGKILWKELDFGTYLVVEDSNSGWTPYSPTTWSVSGAVSATYRTIAGKSGWCIMIAPTNADVTVAAVNRRNSSAIRLLKLDENGNPIKGVRFRIEQSTDSGVTWTSKGVITTGADGYATFAASLLTSTYLYRAVEIQVPEGMSLLAEPIYIGTPTTADGSAIERTIINQVKLDMPNAGTTDGVQLIAAAVIILAAGACLVIYSKKNKTNS